MSDPTDAARGVDAPYGSPFDKDSPPWPVYRDPGRAVIEQRMQAEEERQRRLQSGEGNTYRYDGGGNGDGTQILLTEWGQVQHGEEIKLTEEAVAELRSRNQRFTKVADVAPPQGDVAEQAEKEAAAEVTKEQAKPAESERAATQRPAKGGTR